MAEQNVEDELVKASNLRSERPTVWITGCAGGVGAHLVDESIRRGYSVWATDIDLASLEATADQRSWPNDYVSIRAHDVRDVKQWKAQYQELINHWGRLDIMINNAGVIRPAFLTDADDDDISLQLDVNLKGLINGSQIAARHMIKVKTGHIVNIASLAGLAAVPGLGIYSAGKFGARAYTLVLAEELADKNVKVTVLCPDVIDTPMLDYQLDYEKEAALTFSGSEPLTVGDISKVLFETILPKAPIEVLLPNHRGWLAKLGNLAPRSTHFLAGYLGRKGRKKLLEIRRLRKRT